MLKTNFIGGAWQKAKGDPFHSTDSVMGTILWEGHESLIDDIDQAVTAAREACDFWSCLSFEKRLGYLEKFVELLKKDQDKFAEIIAQEVGKPLWEAKTEVTTMIGKFDLSREAFAKRTSDFAKDIPGGKSITRFKPHGVVAIFGPFNFPAHLPNGHILPALLAGNTIVFKPSEFTPRVGEEIARLWSQSGLPKGVLNLVQGGKNTGMALSQHAGLNGLFFTGSSQTGLSLHRYFADHPEKIVALEMGGNNPLIVSEISDLKAAVYTTIQSAYLTSGQRCTCARRLILPETKNRDKFLQTLQDRVAQIKVGHYTERPEPFMGPVISKVAAKKILSGYQNLIEMGAVPLVPMKLLKEDTALLSPALIDVTKMSHREDREVFGPLLQVIRVRDFNEAIQEANHTAYGLSAGILSDSRAEFDEFYQKIRAGIVNWNRQTTGASGSAPFGGVGLSGNHRPSAYFAADYCSYPVATIEAEKLEMPEKLLPGIGL